jgi:hypothetical protein|tara:strand:+ start:17999 stop:18322 length:324 start_codon:yes stop_codon:yes gene_type:complete
MDSVSGLTYQQKYLRLGVTTSKDLNRTNNFIRKHIDPEVYDTLQDVTDYILKDAYPVYKGKRLDGYIIIDLEKFNKFKIILRALLSDDILNEVREKYQYDISKMVLS